jgi:hypothetical protein
VTAQPPYPFSGSTSPISFIGEFTDGETVSPGQDSGSDFVFYDPCSNTSVDVTFTTDPSDQVCMGLPTFTVSTETAFTPCHCE